MNKENKFILLIVLGLLGVLIILTPVYWFYLEPMLPSQDSSIFCLDTANLTSEERALWIKEIELLEESLQTKGADQSSHCSINQILTGFCSEQGTSAVIIRLGVIYSTLAEPEQSLNYYYSALADWDQDPEFWKLIANEEMTLCRFYQAEDSLTRALDLKPSDVDCWQGLIFMERKKFSSTQQSVRRLYREALAATDNDIGLMIDWADWLDLQGNTEEALVVREEIDRIQQENSPLNDLEESIGEI